MYAPYNVYLGDNHEMCSLKFGELLLAINSEIENMELFHIHL
jgi:hypothetical protein